jgi:hypothetical protein
MSTIGKFFVVLNLALAGLFVGSAASLIGKSDSYRVKYENEMQAKADMESEKDAVIGELTANLQQSQSERGRLNSDNSDLTADKTALQEELDTERQQNTDLRESLLSMDGRLSDLEGTNGQLNNELSALRRQYETVRSERDDALDSRDSANSTANDAVASANLANGQAEDLRLELAREMERANQAEAQLATVVSLYGIDLNTIGAQPHMEGVVTSVTSANGATYVVINLGKKDKVQPGFTYDVFNGSVYKGRIFVHTVNESKSAATVDMSNAPISEGDRVVTRL